ncbi:hypothetical protein IWW38_000633 [Coemansia aciculifera]|uniref:Uncharacterized protein n=1 Tax=Coemansia aciculifera TaxID=417176 RepID=A0ACC1M8H5_9FUNG|nr:hypothetical protein IWW38_000633 [Coemansia aciculifera]
MSETSLPADILTCYIVRHGERIDHIDDTWTMTSLTPYDPPLTDDGWTQAQHAGSTIRDYEADTDPCTTEYIMLVSPFLRCLQTGEGIIRGFNSKTGAPRKWRVAVEPGLSEVINESYFGSAQNVPIGIVAERQNELRERGSMVADNVVYDDGYQAVWEELPEYPEDFQTMLARFGSVLQQVASRYANSGKNVVVVLVTHGAGVAALRWATTRKLEPANDVPYCALIRATTSSQTAPATIKWTVNNGTANL